MNRIIIYVFLLSRWDRAVCSAMAMAIASSVDLLGQYANLSGSRNLR